MLLTYCRHVSKQHAVTCRPGTHVDSFLCHVANMSANMSATHWPDRHMSVILTLVLTRRHPTLPAKTTASCIHLGHIQCVWANWFVVLHTAAALNSYTRTTWVRFWGFGSLVESKWCHYIMAEADSQLKLLPASTLCIYKMFEHIDMLYMGIWL